MNIQKIAPRNDNILVRLVHHAEPEQRTSGGIIMPGTRTHRLTEACEAKVIAVGPGRHLDPWVSHEQGTTDIGSPVFVQVNPDICPGRFVLLERPDIGERIYSDEREEYRMVLERNIVAVIDQTSEEERETLRKEWDAWVDAKVK
jgi:co-chaperonin GroES (HSP10)